MKKKIIAIVASLAILVFAIAVFGILTGEKQKPRKVSQDKNLLNVKTAIAQNERFDENMSYSGRVHSFETVSLSAEVTGKILHTGIPMKEGEYFSKGDLLVSIYKEDNEAALKSLKSSFLRTISALLPDMSVDFADSYGTWKTFFNAIELDQNLPPLPEITNEKERVYLAANGVLTEYYSIKQQEIKADKYTIQAPFNGYYKTVNKTEGSIAAAGTELATIIRSDKLEVSVPVVSSDSRKLKPGQEVTIRKDDITLNGTISRIAGFVNAASQSVNVYVNIKNTSKATIFEGEYVLVDFLFPIKGEGVRINREALIDDQFVYTVKNGHLHKNKVEPLHHSNDYVTVGGLADGDTLVTESLINITEGQKVHPVL